MKLRFSRIVILVGLLLISYTTISIFLSNINNNVNELSSIDFSNQIKQLNDYLMHPAIFIGGSMSSGTSLVRSILDVHPSIKCGPETKFVNLILDYLKSVYTSETSSLAFMKAAGLKNETIDRSIGLAVYYVMLMNVERNVDRLCNKETSNRRHIEFFKRTFPNSKFILVIRDGREVAYSYMKRLGGKISFSRFLSLLENWNQDNIDSYNQCARAGSEYCLVLRYDQLVTSPEKEIRRMINFLGVEWNDRVLNHEKYVQSDVKMSKTEWSRNGMKKKIYSDSLKKWLGNVPGYDEKIVNEKISFLKFLKFI